MIYHLLREEDWLEALRTGRHAPASLEKEGFMHFSDATQLLKSAELYFREEERLLAIGVQEDEAGPALKWEPSREGQLFPHLYRALAPEEIGEVLRLERGTEGQWQVVKKENLAKPRKSQR